MFCRFYHFTLHTSHFTLHIKLGVIRSDGGRGHASCGSLQEFSEELVRRQIFRLRSLECTHEILHASSKIAVAEPSYCTYVYLVLCTLLLSCGMVYVRTICSSAVPLLANLSYVHRPSATCCASHYNQSLELSNKQH